MLIAILLLSGALIVIEKASLQRLLRQHEANAGANAEANAGANAGASASGSAGAVWEGDAFLDGFEAMWCIFWIVTSLGFDGSMGLEGPGQRLIFASAIICGLIFTTMPITIIGEAFRRCARALPLEIASRSARARLPRSPRSPRGR